MSTIELSSLKRLQKVTTKKGASDINVHLKKLMHLLAGLESREGKE